MPTGNDRYCFILKKHLRLERCIRSFLVIQKCGFVSLHPHGGKSVVSVEQNVQLRNSNNRFSSVLDLQTTLIVFVMKITYPHLVILKHDNMYAGFSALNYLVWSIPKMLVYNTAQDWRSYIYVSLFALHLGM